MQVATRVYRDLISALEPECQNQATYFDPELLVMVRGPGEFLGQALALLVLKPGLNLKYNNLQ